MSKSKVLAQAHHRNGVGGAPFTVFILKDGRGKDATRKVAIVFDAPHHVAVLDIGLLAAGNITFGENSWRGDEWEPELRELLAQQEAERDAELEDESKNG